MAAALVLVMGLAGPGAARAAERTLAVDVGRSELVHVGGQVASVVNPNPKLLSIDVRGPHELLVFGLSEGEDEVRLLADDGHELERLVITVRIDAKPLEALLRETFQSPGISAKYVGSALVLSGEVDNAGQVAAAADLAQRASASGVGVINLLKSRGSDDIKVSVRVLEVKRSTLKSLGLKWAATSKGTQGTSTLGNTFADGLITRSGDTNSFVASTTLKVGQTVIDAFVDFLRTEGQARLLAEPTIVAFNGKPAHFLSGGEFPVPVPSSFDTRTTTGGTPVNTFQGIYYKQFGISLAFTATILPDGRIDLQVSPEVSSVDASRSIEYGGNRVPALATRRADTSLRMGSGETVIFAGLTSVESDKATNRMPFGAFHGLDFLAGPSTNSGSETELLIIVTPTIGGAVETPQALKP